MTNWKTLFKNSIQTGKELAEQYDVNTDEIDQVNEHFPFRLNSYYQSLIRYSGDPIWKQVIPDMEDIKENDLAMEDSLNEEGDIQCLVLPIAKRTVAKHY